MNLVYFNDLLRQFVHSHPGVEDAVIVSSDAELDRLAQKIQTEISYAETSILSPPEYLNFTGSIFPQIDGDILPKKTTIANEQKLRTSRFFEPLQRNFLEKRPLLF
ncbi:MAG: hypothetical protein WA999_08210 [Spirulinaceae cyanobacterium]